MKRLISEDQKHEIVVGQLTLERDSYLLAVLGFGNAEMMFRRPRPLLRLIRVLEPSKLLTSNQF